MPSKGKKSQPKKDSLPKKPKSSTNSPTNSVNSKKPAKALSGKNKTQKAAKASTKKSLLKFQKGSVAEAFEKLKGKFSNEELDRALDLIS